jgi:hypothetical protein
MEPPRGTPLILPAAMTYLLARAFDAARVRPGGAAPTARLDSLLRDAVRYLFAAGATLPEVEAAIRDVCEAADAWRADPELRAKLGELEGRARAFAATEATGSTVPYQAPAAPRADAARA